MMAYLKGPGKVRTSEEWWVVTLGGTMVGKWGSATAGCLVQTMVGRRADALDESRVVLWVCILVEEKVE